MKHATQKVVHHFDKRWCPPENLEPYKKKELFPLLQI